MTPCALFRTLHCSELLELQDKHNVEYPLLHHEIATRMKLAYQYAKEMAQVPKTSKEYPYVSVTFKGGKYCIEQQYKSKRLAIRLNCSKCPVMTKKQMQKANALLELAYTV